MKQKKLHAIVKFFYPVAAGIETNMLETYSVLARSGWDVTIHTTRDSHTEKDILPQEEIYRGLKIKRYSRLGGFYWPKFDWKEADLVALHNFDVVPHGQIMLKALADKLLGKKNYALALTPHGGFNPEWAIFPKGIALAKSIYHFTIGTLLINSTVDGVRAVSQWEKAEMIKKGIDRKKIIAISNGIEDEAYEEVEKLASKEMKNKVESWGKYIIQIGRVYMIKNYETTLKALVNVPNDVKYVIAGPISDNEYKKQLDDLIISLGLQDRVIFAGVVRGIDKYYMIKKAQMMVHMALWESFCNVVHEGMSQGLVCIVANNTALPLLIKDGVNGYCVETLDDKTLSEKINYVLKNKNSKEIKQMSEKNRKFGLEESWRSVSEKMMAMYANITK